MAHWGRSVHRAVSASDLRKHDAQEPLQDNVLIALEALIRRAPAVGRWLAEPGVEILQKLVALIALFVSVLGDQVRCCVPQQCRIRTHLHHRPSQRS